MSNLIEIENRIKHYTANIPRIESEIKKHQDFITKYKKQLSDNKKVLAALYTDRKIEEILLTQTT
jgi:predicted  nucleic acid-binding Zn-ribbon protein